MPVKYGNYRTATDRSKLKMASSESEMDFNTTQVLSAAGEVNKSVGIRFENPGSGPNLKLYMNDGNVAATGQIGLE